MLIPPIFAVLKITSSFVAISTSPPVCFNLIFLPAINVTFSSGAIFSSIVVDSPFSVFSALLFGLVFKFQPLPNFSATAYN